MPNPPSDENPLTFGHQWPFLAFLATFLPVSEARSTVSQHMLTKILESVTHTIKYSHLKYYHSVTSRSADFLFFLGPCAK